MLKKLIILFISFNVLGLKAQTQFKIADPTTAFCISEFRKSGEFKSQLTEIGLTDADVTIKVTEPIRKFYSDRAGARIKALIEADMCEYGIEATTRKNASGLAYKCVGYIVCTRTDIASDSYSDYIDKINNNWQIRSFNIDNFTPVGQAYLIDPNKLITAILENIKNGKIDMNSLKTTSSDYVYDIIEIENIKQAPEKPEMLSGTRQKTHLLWDYKKATFTNDTGAIIAIQRYANSYCTVEATLQNGKINIEKFRIDGHEDKYLYNNDKAPYDTLFGALFKDGIDKVYKKKLIIETNLNQKRKAVMQELVKIITALKDDATKEQITIAISKLAMDNTANSLASVLYNRISMGYKPVAGKNEDYIYEINWVAESKKAKKKSPPSPLQMYYNSINSFKKVNGQLKYAVNGGF